MSKKEQDLFFAKCGPNFGGVEATHKYANFEAYLSEHPLTRVSQVSRKQTLCYFCRVNSLRTKSGYGVLTRHKCETCDTPLCKGQEKERPCFVLFHRALYQGTNPRETYQNYIQNLTNQYYQYESDMKDFNDF